MNSNSIPNPFLWGMGWRALFLGCSLGDPAKFENTMEVYSNFTSMAEVHKEADAMVKKGTTKDLKMIIPEPVKGAMSVDILLWAMNQVNSGDARQRAKWAKYMDYKHPDDDRVVVYWRKQTVVGHAEEDNEVQMVAKALAVGDHY
ncbi:Chitinase domain-containing protein 1 [Hordeum vulgare]|nr:Chitinase domain-containing protein 1 [Hordeum vulgare]